MSVQPNRGSVQPNRRLAVYAVAAACTAVVIAPLLALAWFATGDGAETAATGTVAAWAEPASSALRPLLTFADPDAVYATYLVLMAVAFPAIPLATLASRSRRTGDRTALERWGWRLAISGYVLAAVALAVVAVLFVVSADALANIVFLAGMLPGMLLSLVGSTTLGVALLRSRFRPRAVPWLLALAVPLWVVGGFVLGHNSLGLLPLFVAWALAAKAWPDARSATAPRAAPAGSARPA